MHAKDFFVNNGSNRQTVEAVCESFPKLNVITSLALIIKAVDSIDGSAFMVASQNEKIFWVLNLISQKQADSL